MLTLLQSTVKALSDWHRNRHCEWKGNRTLLFMIVWQPRSHTSLLFTGMTGSWYGCWKKWLKICWFQKIQTGNYWRRYEDFKYKDNPECERWWIYAYFRNNHLEDGTIVSCKEDPTIVGGDVIASKFIMLTWIKSWWCSVYRKMFYRSGSHYGQDVFCGNSAFFANCEAWMVKP